MLNDGIKIGDPRDDLFSNSRSITFDLFVTCTFEFHKSLNFRDRAICSVQLIRISFKTFLPTITISLHLRHRILPYLWDDGAGSGGPRDYRSAEARPRLQEGRSSQKSSGRGTVMAQYRFEWVREHTRRRYQNGIFICSVCISRTLLILISKILINVFRLNKNWKLMEKISMQACLAGGKREEGDMSLVDTALREAQEVSYAYRIPKEAWFRKSELIANWLRYSTSSSRSLLCLGCGCTL